MYFKIVALSGDHGTWYSKYEPTSNVWNLIRNVRSWECRFCLWFCDVYTVSGLTLDGSRAANVFFLMCQTGFILYVLINLVTTHMFWSFSNVKGEQQRTWRHFSRHPVILSDDDLGCPITSETHSILVPLTFSVSVIGWLPSLKLTVHTWH